MLPIWTTTTQTIHYAGQDDLVVDFVNDSDPVDVDGTIIGYALAGTDAANFNINSINGTLAFNAAPDYYDQSSYTVEIVASNEFGNTAVNKTLTINILGEFSFDGDYLVVQTSSTETRRTAFTIETLSAGSTLDQQISNDNNFYYVCISGTSWAAMPLIDSDLGYIGYSVGHKVFTSEFVHVYTSSGWKKFAITA